MINCGLLVIYDYNSFESTLTTHGLGHGLGITQVAGLGPVQSVLPNHALPHLIQGLFACHQNRPVIVSPEIQLNLLVFQEVNLLLFAAAQDVIVLELHEKELS